MTTDRMMAAMALLVLAPLLLLALIAIKATQPGPALIRIACWHQGRHITLTQFRAAGPLATLLDTFGLTRLPALIDIGAGRIGFSSALYA